MTGQNHYRVLGVPQDADLSLIRAAYVALLKRHHPDQASGNEAQENAIQIQRIVGAYRALKDPRIRAAYDATLRQMAPRKPPRRPATVCAPKPLHRVRQLTLDVETASYVLMLVVAAVGLHLLVSRFVELKGSHAAGASLARASSVREIDAHTQLEAIVRNAGMMSGVEASSYSTRCFSAARRSRNAIAADPCVGFDMAYVYWRDAMGGALVLDPYFQSDAISSRANDAFRGLKPIDAAARIQSVRAATLRAIMQTPHTTDEYAVALSPNQGDSRPAPAKHTATRDLPQED